MPLAQNLHIVMAGIMERFIFKTNANEAAREQRWNSERAIHNISQTVIIAQELHNPISLKAL